MSTVENVTIAKKAYETFYNIIEKNLYLTIKKISVNGNEKIQEDFQKKYFAGEDSLTNLDSWIEFYYHFGRFPGSDHFTNVPHAEMPYYLKTTMPLSPMKLHTSFRGTDAKGIASLHALAALNIYFGGSQDVSKLALGKYLKNLTYQALSDENDNIYLSFTYGASLIHSLLEALTRKQKQEIEKSKEISEKIKDKLDITFDTIESPAMKIQLGEEESEAESEYFIPKKFSTPLNKKEVAEMYDRQMDDYLKIAMKLNQTNLESTIEVADSENEELIDEIINPTPGLIVDDNVSLSQSFDSDLDTSYTLSDTLNTRLDDILENVKTKISSLSYLPEPVEDIPNDPLYPLRQISAEDNYIDESLTNMLYPGGEEFYFKRTST